MNLGIYDQDCQYHCVGSRVFTRAKNGANTAELMFEMIQKFPNMIPKLHSIISDQAAYQLAANRQLSRMLGKDLQQLTCSLHTVSNGDGEFNGRLPLAEQAVHCSKMLYGCRQSWEHSNSSLRNELEIGLLIEEGRRFSPFKNDRGSRFAVGYRNAMSLIKYRDLVLRTLDTPRARKISYASKLKQLLTVNWTQTCLQLGCYIIHWLLVLNPFYAAMGQTIELGSGKAFARELKDKYQLLLDSSNQLETMLEFINADTIAEYPCLTVVTQMWRTCEVSEREEVNSVLQAAVERAGRKIMKDTQLVLDLTGERGDLLPFSNNRVESHFSLIKVNARYSSLVVTYDFSIFTCGLLL